VTAFLCRHEKRGTARIEPGASTGNGSHRHRVTVTTTTTRTISTTGTGDGTAAHTSNMPALPSSRLQAGRDKRAHRDRATRAAVPATKPFSNCRETASGLAFYCSRRSDLPPDCREGMATSAHRQALPVPGSFLSVVPPFPASGNDRSSRTLINVAFKDGAIS
jgi:hypothetical protein